MARHRFSDCSLSEWEQHAYCGVCVCVYVSRDLKINGTIFLDRQVSSATSLVSSEILNPMTQIEGRFIQEVWSDGGSSRCSQGLCFLWEGPQEHQNDGGASVGLTENRNDGTVVSCSSCSYYLCTGDPPPPPAPPPVLTRSIS